jgi:RNA polymerase sigma-70 factor (ECF subfamily)
MTDPHIHRALEQLPEQQRADIALAYWSGLSHAEIAAQLNISTRMVKTRTRAALSRLAELLESDGAC